MKKNNAFALAAASLMSATNVSSVSAAEWSHELNTFLYSESDNRVSDKSAKYSGKASFNDGDTLLNLNLGVDILTGASPTGALPTDGTTTIITSPSGGTQTINSSSTLEKSPFNDKRYSFDVGLDKAINDAGTRANIGLSYSKENDYKHLGLSTGLSKEINNKNTTLAVGLAYSSDTIEPIGGIPLPLSTIGTNKISSTKSKKAVDMILGVTQILSKNTIAQFNYGYSNQTGYLSDAYKRISVIDNSGKTIKNIHEARPETRTGHNFFGAIKHSLSDGNVITGTARLHADKWGTNSLTGALKYRIALASTSSIEPYVRFYHQSAADFYTPQLSSNKSLPSYASSDYRLSEFSSYTLGATYRLKTSSKNEWNLTGEYYKQAPGTLKFGEDDGNTSGQTVNNPGYNAFILSLGLKF